MHLSYPSPLKNAPFTLNWRLFIPSVLLIFAGVLWHFYPQDLSFRQPPAPVVSSPDGLVPHRLKIPGLNLDLAVIPAQIINNKWSTTPDGISFLATSALPGQRGNSIFYGHNWPNILGKLKDIKIGDMIEITSTSSASLFFNVREIKRVDPSDISVLEPYFKPTLTLYTCIGLFDSQRLVVVAPIAL